MTVKSELDRLRLSYVAFRYDAGTGMFEGYDGSSWKKLDKVRYNAGTFEGWDGSGWVSLASNVDAEITARRDADSTLQANLNTEITARSDADLTLQANIDAEVTARTDADVTLQANIDAEITARELADSSLQTSIDSEITARTDADITLQANIDAEITARELADSTLQANIDAEITARRSADSTINSVGIGSGNGTTGSGTIGGGNLKVDLGALTSTWDATAYNISVKTPTTAAHATTKEYVDQLAITGGTIREALLTEYQLKNGASGGILGAEVVYFNTNPGINDTIVLKNASVTETFTFKAARGGAFEVTIGTLPVDTMTNFAAAITSDSTAWLGHVAADGLDAINTIGVVLAINLSTTTATSRIYGTWATQADCKVVEFYDSYPFEYRTSKVAITLPSSDPAAERFGYREAIGVLTDGEIHLCLETDTLMSWHVDTQSWLTLSGSGSLPDATAGAGGGLKGKVTLDSDRGLNAASGIAFVKIDNSTIKYRSSGDSNLNGQLIVDPGLLNAEITARTNADDAEITARTNADVTLQANINSEYSARLTADSSLQGNINTEYSARLAADSTLQTNINNIVPGLEIVATTAALIDTTTLANRKHYLIDMSAATTDILVSLPAIAAKQNIKVEVYNNSSNGYRCAVDTTGSELIVYDGTGYDSVLVGPLESWIEFASDTTNWVAEDAVGGTVFATVGVVFKTASYLAAAWDDIGADTTIAAFTITLPGSPVAGQTVKIRDVAGNAATNNITVARNGKKIAGASADFTIDLNWLDITFVYYNTTIGWAPVK